MKLLKRQQETDEEEQAPWLFWVILSPKSEKKAAIISIEKG